LSVFQDHDYHEWRPPVNSKLPLLQRTREGLFFAGRVEPPRVIIEDPEITCLKRELLKS